MNRINSQPDQRVALVTGSGRGIGRAIALALANKHWSVVLNYCKDENSAQTSFQQIHQMGGNQASLIQADIRHREDRERLLDQIQAKYDRLDLLVNNVGIAPRNRADILELTESSYDEVMEVNLKGPFFLTQLTAKWMIDLLQIAKIKSPKIINIGSISAYASSTNRAEYCLSKAGTSMMTTLFADRLAEYGITVFEIRPGIISTDMTRPAKEKYDQLLSQGIAPIRRWGQPEDVAAAVLAIAEGYLPYSTGEVINVDGGFHIRRL